MNNSCTNCGKPNDEGNSNCVECGNPLVQEEKAAMVKESKTRQPDKKWRNSSFKAKLSIAIALILVAALAGFYSWGTKTASADSTLSSFFEALQKKDADALSKVVAVSDGSKLSVKEAEAFINLYGNRAPAELEEIATVEKSGKVAGVFDSHKIVLSPQKASFSFPYEGLVLKLNGEKKDADFAAEGEYIFSGIVPGQYKAEFIFDDGQTVYDHPFDLTVNYQGDSGGAVAIIEESLPLGSASFRVEAGEYESETPAKVIIGENEYPVNENGQTEEIGPVLLDGSLSAQAQVAFPWGEAVSEAVPVTGKDVIIAVNKLNKEIEEQVLKQFTLFLEEDLEAKATRDAAVYTFLTPGLVKRYADEFDVLLGWQNYLKGSLTQINLDGESIGFWAEGISVDAEVIYEAAEYYGADVPELEKMKTHATAKFIYDAHEKKWIVKEYWTNDNSKRSFTLEPIRLIEGSKKIYEYEGTAATTKDKEEASGEPEAKEGTVKSEKAEPKKEAVAVSNDAIELFMNDYNTLSSKATVGGDFSLVSDLITQNGPKRKEAIDYIASVFARGISTEHLGSSVDAVEAIDAVYVKVTTTERFLIHGTERSSEKTYRTVNILAKHGDSWQVNELISTKEI